LFCLATGFGIHLPVGDPTRTWWWPAAFCTSSPIALAQSASITARR